MNILQMSSCHYWPAIGGTEQYLWNLCRALETSGHNPVFVYDSGRVQSETKRPEYHIPGFSAYDGDLDLGLREGLGEIIIRHNVDLAHLHGVWNPSVIKWLAERVPVVRSDHEHSLHCPSGNKYFRTTGGICTHPFGPRCIWDALLKGCNSRRPYTLWQTYQRTAAMRGAETYISHFIVASQFVKHWLVRNGYLAWKITVLPYFVESVSGPSSAPVPLGVENDNILFVGRVVREKGWREFLLALTHVKVLFQAAVSGDGPDLPAMKRLCTHLGLAPKVDFLGWLPQAELIERYRRASVVVLSSVWPEPFGIVGIEAMSFAKPVVAFKVGGIPEWLEDGVTGFLVTPYDLREMADKINFLLDHPDVAHEMGMRGRKRVEREFTKETHIARLLDIYKKVIASRPEVTARAS